MRTRLIAFSGVAALALAGCVSYPGLTDNTTTAGTGGTVSAATASSGSSAGGSTSGATGPQQPASGGGSTPTSQPAETGTVQDVLCSKAVIIEFTQTSEHVVFQSTSDAANFAEWLTDDSVAYDPSAGTLNNKSRNQTVAVESLGTVVTTTRFLIANSSLLTATLQDGSLWVFTVSDFNEVRQWLTGSDTITVARQDTTGKAGILVNHRRCTATTATQQ